MKIYLSRHSESQDDLINCNGGVSDWDITEGGAKKVEDFRPIYESFGIEKYYSSPLKRAYKTAEILNKNTKVPLEKIFELHESNNSGCLTGLEKNLARELFAYLLERPEYQNINYYNRNCMFGGEKPDDLDKRIKGAIKQIVGKSKGLKTIGIITHGGVIKSFFWSILKDKRKILIDDVGYAEINFEKGKFELVRTEGIKFE